MRLKDQVAIVTGAASGFGAEIARQYVAKAPRWRWLTSMRQARNQWPPNSVPTPLPSPAT